MTQQIPKFFINLCLRRPKPFLLLVLVVSVSEIFTFCVFWLLSLVYNRVGLPAPSGLPKTFGYGSFLPYLFRVSSHGFAVYKNR